MFSSLIRLGIAVSGAALLSSCGGSSGQALTQQSTPEGLFTGVTTIPVAGTTPELDTTWLVFVTVSGGYYAFYTQTNPGVSTPVATGVVEGALAFAGGGMNSSNGLNINLPGKATSTSLAAANVDIDFSGAYNTAINIAGTFTFPNTGATESFNLNYNSGYQGIQNLSTLAGTYTGTIGTSAGSEAATFTFGPASVLANSTNQFGVGMITGTSAEGCTYTGTVSPLYKGNGYTTEITSGGAPCKLPNTQFAGLIYLDTTNNLLYSFSPNLAQTDGILFNGSRIN